MKRMRYSLRTTLTLSYLLIVLAVIGLSGLAANTYVKGQFKNYVVQRQEKQTTELINLILRQYLADGALDPTSLEHAGMGALEWGMVIRVADDRDELVWSATDHNAGLCEAMMSNMQRNMQSYYADWEGAYQETLHPLMDGDTRIGTLTVGTIGPFYFNDEELLFLRAFNRMFLLMGLLSLLLAATLGAFMSFRISTPLHRTARRALDLAEGRYPEKLADTSSTTEIQQLMGAINQLAEALEGKEKLRKQLTQDVAHELRTPLTSVQGHMEAMIDGIWPMDVGRLSSCHEEVLRIQKLVGSLEDLSGIENGNLLLHKKEFDLSQLVLGILANHERDLLDKRIQVDYVPETTLFFGDPDKMGQVFHNLLSNAVKYSRDGGSVRIRMERDSGNLWIRIRDTGIGIAAEDLPLIFERFYRVDKSRNHSTGGIGVGLTITKSIVEAHGGNIQASSILGQGTEIAIRLPL
ncbi:sensor histidine kinase [Anaerotalea alkaliphila]|uniref:histidine kinase n=1 Tax=Anaerotalea alkaliphila TaxID=2662126 RepID=A0A7X5KN69_9FIRM|nr:HAMP domain-containing sensor histidine kinase [Anaerotalea alkaliphila]NDL66482.1 HAMP domain-containing protein [Anaerotalea alkaliphila]